MRDRLLLRRLRDADECSGDRRWALPLQALCWAAVAPAAVAALSAAAWVASRVLTKRIRW